MDTKMTNDIVELLTTSESVGILHTWFYRALNAGGALFRIAHNNCLDVGRTNSTEGFYYTGEYTKIMLSEMISAYYKECSDEGIIMPINVSKSIGNYAAWQPTEKVSNVIHKCVEKTVKEWKEYVNNLSSQKLTEYFNDGSGLVTADNIDDIKSGIINWLSDDTNGAIQLIKKTLVYEAKECLLEKLNELNYEISLI